MSSQQASTQTVTPPPQKRQKTEHGISTSQTKPSGKARQSSSTTSTDESDEVLPQDYLTNPDFWALFLTQNSTIATEVMPHLPKLLWVFDCLEITAKELKPLKLAVKKGKAGPRTPGATLIKVGFFRKESLTIGFEWLTKG